MILCVDVGNSSVKIAAVDESGVHDGRSSPTRGNDVGAGVVGSVVGVLGSVAPRRVKIAVVSSVVPDATRSVVESICAVAEMPVRVVSHRHAFPFELDVGEPGRVGTDRLCAASGAVDSGCDDAVVVDVGSAITVDLVSARRFLGGAILPGALAMLGGLQASASQLPSVTLDGPSGLFPDRFDTTEDAMALGAGMATLGGIQRCVRHLSRRVGAPVPVWFTGGGAGWYRGRIPRAWRRDPDLTMRGLYRIAVLNAWV